MRWPEVREFKLSRTTETRNTCPYCSVGCGILIYSLGDKAQRTSMRKLSISRATRSPVNRGTLCPKGVGLPGFREKSQSPQHPEYRAPGSKEWTRISWDDAFTRIAKLMKADRDKNFIAKNADGQTVNRW